LWGGSVVDVSKQDVDTQAIRALNKKLQADQRIALSQLPIADGLTLCLKH
jgi:caffeoyl-CoA O-methyltransferase